ncbi:MAG: hypothetical protein EA414_01910 [Arthrospira sp. PLM2.Bin9]|nr:hypothetical protein [Arthrospira sp. PLM2.Bin9]TVU55404.1 MAG: hypothetical protein EA414_01910 [Arthrospira sp. PLM2.Bin9]
MASENQVKQYLAHWFQLGKKVVLNNGSQTQLPLRIIAGDRYSQEFEECWEQILSPESGDCYLEGTNETIAQLLTPEWEIIDCARCAMPIPVRIHGMPTPCCPCFDLKDWPNSESPAPRLPVNSLCHLLNLCHRLKRESIQQP